MNIFLVQIALSNNLDDKVSEDTGKFLISKLESYMKSCYCQSKEICSLNLPKEYSHSLCFDPVYPEIITWYIHIKTTRLKYDYVVLPNSKFAEKEFCKIICACKPLPPTKFRSPILYTPTEVSSIFCIRILRFLCSACWRFVKCHI